MDRDGFFGHFSCSMHHNKQITDAFNDGIAMKWHGFSSFRLLRAISVIKKKKNKQGLLTMIEDKYDGANLQKILFQFQTSYWKQGVEATIAF